MVPGRGLASWQDLFVVSGRGADICCRAFAVSRWAFNTSAVPVAVFEGSEAEVVVEGAGEVLALAVTAAVGDGGEVEVRVLEKFQCLELVPLVDEGVDAHAGEDV